MIHLFKKVYVATDKTIDIDHDRVVISEENGVDLASAYETVAGGNLIMYDTNTTGILSQAGSWQEFFMTLNNFAENSGKRVTIFCDDTAILEVMCAWYISLLPNSTESSIKTLIKGSIFRYNVFGYADIRGAARANDLIDISTDTALNTAYSSLSSVPAFTDNQLINYAGVEFLLATYLTSGDKKEELKTSLKPLIRKELDRFILEQREIFFAHCITRRFKTELNFGSSITYDNIADVLDDTSKYPAAMLNDRIWNHKYMSVESSQAANGAVDLESMTADDIQDMKDFIAAVSSETIGWLEDDVSKLDFLPIFTSGEFTDEMLTQVINTESTFANLSGLFFSIDLATVNHYLVTEILERNSQSDSSWISKYSLVAS